ncbi:MAG: T9SS type A sorting domain-containing protein [Bacteroidota bacterium]|nr:T9SS type A sorting domain-containing protein [Bacteroidota bacterium]
MNIKDIIILCVFSFISLFSYGQEIYINENFDGSTKPADWTYFYESGDINWSYLDGGYTTGEPGSSEPPYAFQGERNAVFYFASPYNETTKLITPPIDLSYAIKPKLVFWHAQADKLYGGGYNHDELRIYYKTSFTSPWVLLAEYTDEVPDWTERNILLPDSSLTSTYYIAFEGKTKNGFGTCVDSMFVIETGIIPRYVESINTKQASSLIVPTSSENNKMVRVDISVKGNDGTIILDSIAFKSLNTNDTDISANGVKLFVSNDTTYYSATQISTGKNFNDETVSFYNLNYELPTGLSSVWLTYDIKEDENHNLQNHILDAYVPTNGIKINGNYFPSSDQSPSGNRKIAESIFFDNFENVGFWTFTGEFERDTAQGKGGGLGDPDPENAVSGSYIIGTDISDNGNYENNMNYHDDQAITPLIDAEYYKDTRIYFHRWLNIEVNDSAFIEYSTNGGTDWHRIWFSNATINDSKWKFINLDTKNFLDKKSDFQVNISLGGTSESWVLSGWNIDDFFITGDYISKDVGITDWIYPTGGCGHTDEEYITVEITNFAGDPLTDPLPLSFSFDGGTSIYQDTILAPNLAVKSSMTYEIKTPIDLTTPGWFLDVYAETNLPGDEVSTNNRLTTEIFITPTYSLPYIENFETNDGYYLSGGDYSSWSYGIPAGTIINGAASGDNAWVTSLSGTYNNNEDSYLETPCFNFGGADSIIFEFKCKGLSEDQTDGLTIMYTFNEGETWEPLPNDHDYSWNWYNEGNISALGLPGIDDTNEEWLTYRQLLPEIFSNQSLVKFRFAFKSNSSLRYEGFGIDDIKIYEAPYDVGVSAMTYPYDACEWKDTTHVKIYIENYGPNAVKTGTDIPLVMKFKTSTLRDTLTLSEDLAVQDSVLYTFGSTVDMSYAGDYDFILYTKLENDPFYYSESCNDSLVTSASVLGMPNYNPFPDVIGEETPINITLDAGEESPGVDYTSYAWSPAGSNRTLNVSSAGTYSVTVTNSESCPASDQVEVVASEVDLTMTQIYTVLEDSCEREDLTELSVQVTNNSLKNLEPVTDTVDLAYQVNNQDPVTQSFALTSTFAIGATQDFTFTQEADFRTVNDYTLKVFVDLADDLNPLDDTLTSTFSTKGYVDIHFDQDTIYTSQTDTLELSPIPAYDNYTWSTGETSDTITPADNISQWYIVTVNDNFVCGSDTDSVYVETYDLGVTAINNPTNGCEDTVSLSIPLSVTIKNYSGNTYPADKEINISYNFDNNGWNDVTVTPGADFGPNSTRTINIGSIEPTEPGLHTFIVTTLSNIDANHSNDTIFHHFETYQLPDVELAYDTIFTTRADTVLLIAETQGDIDSYLWNTGNTNDTLFVSDNYSSNYIVEVTDINSCGSDKDSTSIITYDFKLDALTFPKDGCSHTNAEHVTINIKNNGDDLFHTGQKIMVGYIFNNSTPVLEEIILETNLFPSQTIEYTFTEKINMQQVGSYSLSVFTDFNYDANRTNDTISNIINTFGYPVVDIGEDIYTSQPDTVMLIADPGYNNYSWNDGTKDDTLQVSYPASYNYIVTVTSINGCSTRDSLNVFTYNVNASGLVAPENQCELTDTEEITLAVHNNSMDTLLHGESISASYNLNNGSPVTETFNLPETLYPDSTYGYTFTQTADLSVNQTHQFKLFAKLTDIDVNLEDTTSASVDFLKPEFDLGDDVNVGTGEYTIDAGAGYTSYLWYDGSTEQTYTVDINDQTPNQYYAVTVTNNYGCEATDSVKVTFDLEPDIAVTNMFSPTATCWIDGESYPVEIEITNAGVINLASGTEIQVGYRIANETPFTDTYVLSSDLTGAESIYYTFDQEISFPEGDDYLIKTFAKLPVNDEDIANDTLPMNVNISSPDVSLSPDDTIYFTDQVTLNAGNWENYLWQDGSTKKTYEVTTEGLYSVTVTDALGCQGYDEVYCAISTGMDNIIQHHDYIITYFPNPVHEELKIVINAQRNLDVHLDLINTHGQVVYNQKLSRVKDVVERIYVRNYAQGVYYLRFRMDEKFYVRKIIIQ